MEHLRIIPDLEKVGFQDGEYTVIPYTGPLIVGGMPNGTAGGNPSVMLAIEVGEGEWLVKETTLNLFLAAADALKAKYEDPRERGTNGAQ